MLVGVLALLSLVATSIALPGGPPVGMDYLAYDAASGRLWVPAGNTGRVDVVDAATGRVTAIAGLATAPGAPGHSSLGPSSAAVGERDVWIGNRADRRVCGFDRRTLAPGRCEQLTAMPDGLTYVAPTHEVWITTPRARTITVMGVTAGVPGAVTSIPLPGSPEGYAVDADRGVFYTNLEDHDETLAIDVRTRAIVGRWPTGCGAGGPRGLAIDPARRWLFSACTDGAVVFSLADKVGRPLGRLRTCGGVDNIDYDPAARRLFVASSIDGALTIARLSDSGAPTAERMVATAKGARVVVVGGRGTAYVADPRGGRLIVVSPPFSDGRAPEPDKGACYSHPT
jgi:DNA-binding beta-propeller fold protein YncE